MRFLSVVALLIVLILGLGVVGVPLSAATVTARVDSGPPCTDRLGKLEFEAPGTLVGRVSSFTAMIAVDCAPRTSFRLHFTSSNGCRLESNGRSIGYALYLDAAGTKLLMDCGPSAVDYRGRGSETFMIYGRTTPLRDAAGNASFAPGTYRDGIDLELESF